MMKHIRSRSTQQPVMNDGVVDLLVLPVDIWMMLSRKSLNRQSVNHVYNIFASSTVCGSPADRNTAADLMRKRMSVVRAPEMATCYLGRVSNFKARFVGASSRVQTAVT